MILLSAERVMCMDEYRIVFIRNVQKLMDARGLTQSELAEKIGVSRAVISSWMTGVRFPRMGGVEKLAAFFGVDKSELLEPKSTGGNSRRIPVVGRVAAGIPIEAIQEITDWEEISETFGDPRGYFALEVSGDSMYPYIMDGSRVIVRKQSEAHNGQVAVVMVGREDATLKQVSISSAGITLTAYNARVYPPHSYTAGEIISLPITIVGVAVEVRMKL